MKKQVPKKAGARAERVNGPSLEFSYLVILLVYAVITVITPNLYTLDSNGPKFLSLSFLNLVTYLYLLSRKELKAEPQLHWSFFRNKIGLVYTLFLLVMLISFTKAINISESIITFLKYFTVFAAAYNMSIMLRKDKRYIRYITIVLAIVLITDCFTVFYNILLYISKQVDSIYDIKSVYSNKNMLAAAIFIKVPFALWLATFEKGWWRKFGFFTIFCALLAILYMSTRTFYLGLIFLALFYGIYILVVTFREKAANSFKMLIWFFGALVVASVLYSGAQRYLFPKTGNIYNESFTQRISSSFSGESSSAQRLGSWQRSAILFKQNPLLGVGIGNWKIQVLKYENPTRSDFTYMVKNHNDFIEIIAETGVFGGLFFISIFAFLILNFVIAFFKPGATENSYKYLFLPAFGIFCYSFDAFFNFPADRPEMQSLFAIFIAAGIAFTPLTLKESKTTKKWMTRLLSFLLIAFLLASSYVLLLNFNSLKLQRYVKEDLQDGKLNRSSTTFLSGFPSLPNVNIDAEPIAVIKARYLINENKFQDAINILRTDRSSPYDSRREYFMSMAFSMNGNDDSALIYAYKAHALKTREFKSAAFISNSLEKQNKRDEAAKMMEDFVKVEKNSSPAWLYLTAIYTGSGQYEDAIRTIDSAARYFAQDSTILKQQADLHREGKILPYKEIYTTAMDYYNKKNYPQALKYMNEFISKEPGVAISYARRAFCHYFTKDYANCLLDIEKSISMGHNTNDLINLRGICYHMQGNDDQACKDFQEAIAKGNQDAVSNAARFCKGR